MDVETLAKILHEAGREAVLTNKVVKKDGNPIGHIKFIEWDELKEEAKEGRRIQARYILNQYDLSPRTLKAIYDMIIEEIEKRGIPKSILMGDKPGIVKDDNNENKEDKSIARTECEMCGNPIYVIDETNENAQDAVNHLRFVCSTPCFEMYQEGQKK